MIFVGDDWAEAHHDVYVCDEIGSKLVQRRLLEGVEGVTKLHELVAELVDEPAEVVVGIETDRGLWVQSLVEAGYRVYAINPKAASRYRDRHTVREVGCLGPATGSNLRPRGGHAGDVRVDDDLELLRRTSGASMVTQRRRGSARMVGIGTVAMVASLVLSGCVSGSQDSTSTSPPASTRAASPEPAEGSVSTDEVIGEIGDAPQSTEADGVVVSAGVGDLAEGATLYAEPAMVPDSPVPVVGPVIDLGTTPDGGLVGEATVEFPVPPDVDPDGIVIAYWDVALELWVPYPTEVHGDKVVARTDHFSTFSLIDWETWTDARNPLTAFVYGTRVVTGQRATEPTCEGDPPAWMGEPQVPGSFDDQLLVCVGSDGDQAVVRVANNRGIPAIISSNHEFARPPSHRGDATVRDLLVLALEQTAAQVVEPSTTTLVLATGEVELRFDPPAADSLDEFGTPPTISIDMNREARGHLVILQFWLELMKILNIDAAALGQYVDCAVAATPATPDGADAATFGPDIASAVQSTLDCVTTTVDASLRVAGEEPPALLRGAKRVLAVLGRTLDGLLVFDLYLDELADVRRDEAAADVKLPLCGASTDVTAAAGCEVVLITSSGVGTLQVGRSIDQQIPDPVLGPPPTEFYEEPGGYAEIVYDDGSVWALGRSHSYLTVRADVSSQGVPIRTERGIGVGSPEAVAVDAYPDAVQPCGPGSEIVWENVTMFLDSVTDEIFEIVVFTEPPSVPFCTLADDEYVDF